MCCFLQPDRKSQLSGRGSHRRRMGLKGEENYVPDTLVRISKRNDDEYKYSYKNDMYEKGKMGD